MAMPDAISNTSPLLYLHRIGAINWLPRLFICRRILALAGEESEDL
jgi:hypothetical protein